METFAQAADSWCVAAVALNTQREERAAFQRDGSGARLGP